MKASWETRLFKISKWCFGSRILLIVARFIFVKSWQGFFTEIDAIWLPMAALACLAGTALNVLLLWPLYQHLFLGNWPGRLLVGLLGLGFVAVAKIFADRRIVIVTLLPAEWFPRSQEIMTGLNFVAFLLLPFLFLILLWGFILFLVNVIGGLINVFCVKSGWHDWFRQKKRSISNIVRGNFHDYLYNYGWMGISLELGGRIHAFVAVFHSKHGSARRPRLGRW
jgi:hypothetical protein